MTKQQLDWLTDVFPVEEQWIGGRLIPCVTLDSLNTRYIDTEVMGENFLIADLTEDVDYVVVDGWQDWVTVSAAIPIIRERERRFLDGLKFTNLLKEIQTGVILH